MPDLPTGTVTFLFTDIEGSTRLLHELGDAYTDALAKHRGIVRNVFSEHSGVEVDTQGDAFFGAFARASDAVAAAAAVQRELEPGPIRVRIGLHTGEPERTDEGYVGLDLHRGARICAAGHGGQVLLSQPTRDLVDVDTHDLGEHRLKDLLEPQRLFQLGAEQFPPLKTLNWTNLPVQATPLVGREQELSEAIALLREHRILTLVGPPGTGKRASPFSSRPRLQTSSSTSGGLRSSRSANRSWSRRRSPRPSAPETIWPATCATAGPCCCSTTSSRCSAVRLAWPSSSPLRATSSWWQRAVSPYA